MNNEETYVIILEPQARRADGTDQVFWNNTYGWVDLDSATQFTREQMQTLFLPRKGEWIDYQDAVELNEDGFERYGEDEDENEDE